MNELQKQAKQDLSVTALYTSHTWVWGGFDGAELLATDEARAVFRVTNLALGWMRLFRWRLPRLAEGLVQRHAMIDALFDRSGARVLVELASGLSRRGASLSADPRIHCLEVDLPHVAQRKRTLLERTEVGRSVLSRPNWDLVSADLVEQELTQLPIPEGTPFVTAEGLLMYFEAEQQRALWRRVAGLLRSRGGGEFVFDLVPGVEQPRPGLFGRALAFLMKRFTGGKGFEFDDRDRDAIRSELLEAGFDEVEMLEPADLPTECAIPHLKRRTQVLIYRAGVRDTE